MNQVAFQAWRANVGRAVVYLLDANRPENEQHFRDLTQRVYGGDSTTRIMQEMLLGIGGVRLLRALGVQPSVFHMNEGHAAFLTLELVREKMAAGKSLPEALSQTKAECIFTTHTPVEAGHDRFSPDLMDYAMHRFRTQIPAPFGELMKLGRVNPENQQEPFCMTVLALKLSRAANAVSELHGRVSRHMWHCLYPDKPVEQVPIGHITNGIHLLGWMKGTVRRFWQRKLATAAAATRSRLVFARSGAGLGRRRSTRRSSGSAWRTMTSFPTRKSGPCAPSCAASSSSSRGGGCSSRASD